MNDSVQPNPISAIELVRETAHREECAAMQRIWDDMNARPIAAGITYANAGRLLAGILGGKYMDINRGLLHKDIERNGEMRVLLNPRWRGVIMCWGQGGGLGMTQVNITGAFEPDGRLDCVHQHSRLASLLKASPRMYLLLLRLADKLRELESDYEDSRIDGLLDAVQAMIDEVDDVEAAMSGAEVCA